MKPTIRTSLLAAALTVAAASSALADASGQTGDGMTTSPMMQQGRMPAEQMPHGQMPMGHGQMMGPGRMMNPMMQHMMGQGHGMGCGMARERDLSADDVRKIYEAQLVWRGNPRLKIGKVEEKTDETVVVEIVTRDDSLVDRLAVDRKTGAAKRLP